MNGKNAYIISLKFAPGLKKEFMVLGENIRNKGVNVKYLLSSRYRQPGDNSEGIEYITSSEGVKGIILDTLKSVTGKKFLRIFSLYPPIFLCFYNPHPLNPLIAKLVKRKFPQSIIVLYLHEPYVPDKKPYGRAKAAYITIAEFIQGLTIRYLEHVIFPSEYSFRLFKERYPRFKGKTHIAPLLVPDQRVLDKKKRRFFSIVGGAHQATGHGTFIDLVNYVALNGLDYEFALISSSNISIYLEKLNNQARKILRVVNKGLITDSEINAVVRKSYAVFRLDREVTQSGVIPVSYMNATPVIVRDIPGLTQHVKHGENGYVVPFDCTLEELVRAMRFAREKFPQLSETTRKSYEEIWGEWNWHKYYDWLAMLLKSN